MGTRATRSLTVHATAQRTPHLKRIDLRGEALADFPEGAEGGYVKLLLAGPAGPVRRSYTVRAFDAATRTLTIEAVLHEPAGPAGAWIRAAAPGDRIGVDGPGSVQLVDPTADWALLAGDMTALPALAVCLQRLPAHMEGHAVVEVLSEEDRQALDHPPGVEVEWLVVPRPRVGEVPLADRVRALPWRRGRPTVWAAAEFGTSRALRRYLRGERGLTPESLYLSSYWKLGATDEEHKRAKKAAAD